MKTPEVSHDHQVQFYERDSFLMDALSDFIGGGLEEGHACLVIATEAHRTDLERRLRAWGSPWGAALRSDRYMVLDADETLARFMVDGWPDQERFSALMITLLRRTARNGDRRLFAFGEMVSLLWERGSHHAAVRLEELWDDLVRTHSFTLLCAYPLRSFNSEAHIPFVQQICRAHSRIFLADRLTDRGRARKGSYPG